jgi:hypothetical protein
MTIRNELLLKGGAVSGGVGATYTGGTFLAGVNVSLGTGLSIDLALTTGVNEIVLDSPIVNSNSGDLSFDMFEDSVFTGGNPITAYINDRNSTLIPDINTLVLDPTVTDDGVQIIPTVQSVGDNTSGRARTFLLGYPFIFKPMTNYVLRITHNDGQTRQVNMYIAAFRRRDV